MVIYSLENNSFKKVDMTTFSEEGILERQHLQSIIKQEIGIIAEDCLVIAEEFSEWSDSKRRIDLLAIDKQANLVVIELKRTETGGHMELQSLRYAAMISTLTFKRAVEIYQNYLMSINNDSNETNAEEKLLDFLQWEEAQEDNFALDVRIILVSSDFSKELTTSVMWLNERDIDIRCIRLIPYKYQEKILVDIQPIIPLPEVESYQIKIKQQSEERREARRSSKDRTKYLFNGEELNKRKFVLAVIQKWVSDNHPQNLSELLKAFPQSLGNGRLFIQEEEAQDIYKRQGISRHFLRGEEILRFSESTNYAISNQWGIGNISPFLNRAKELGYEFEEINY